MKATLPLETKQCPFCKGTMIKRPLDVYFMPDYSLGFFILHKTSLHKQPSLLSEYLGESLWFCENCIYAERDYAIPETEIKEIEDAVLQD